MNSISVKLDVGLWLDYKGSVLLYVEDDPKEVEDIKLSELVRMSVEAYKFAADPLDRDDAKKFVKLKKELVKCLDYLNAELNNAK